jgi:hypothetical protein
MQAMQLVSSGPEEEGGVHAGRAAGLSRKGLLPAPALHLQAGPNTHRPPPLPPPLPTLVLRPFWCPTNMKAVPSRVPMPHTMAGSSRPARSPCSSTNLSVMLRMMSSAVGRLGWRATARR